MFTFPLMEDVNKLSYKGDGLHLKQARDCSDTQNDHVWEMSSQGELAEERRAKSYVFGFGQSQTATTRMTETNWLVKCAKHSHAQGSTDHRSVSREMRSELFLTR